MSENSKPITVKAVTKKIQDSFANVLTGLGVAGKDKRKSAKPAADLMTDNQLEALFRAEAMARKIVERIPSEGTREWIQITNTEKETESKIVEEMKRLKTRKVFREAWTKARIYGGSIIFMGINDNKELSEEVDINNIADISNLIVFGKDELDISSPEIDDDIKSSNFGLPKNYTINSTRGISTITNKVLHHTRALRFDGPMLTQQDFRNNNFWHDSVLVNLLNPIQNYSTSNDSAAYVMTDFRVGVLKMSDLIDKISAGCETEIIDRLNLLKKTISVLGIMVINEDEEYQQNTPRLNGIDEILQKITDRLVAESGIPHTILLGQSPTGMQATGGSELKDFYQTITNQQEDILRPNLDTFFNYMLASKKGPTNGEQLQGFQFKFPSLFQLSDKERSEIKKNMAQSDKEYIESGVLDTEEVALSRFGGDQFSQETMIFPERIEEGKERFDSDDSSEVRVDSSAFDEMISDGKRVLQTVVISKEVGGNLDQAKKILSGISGAELKKSDSEGPSFRFRQRSQSLFKDKSFKSFNLKKGVTLVFGELKD